MTTPTTMTAIIPPATTPATSATAVATPPPAAPTPASPAPPPITGVANGSNKGKKVDLQTAYLALVTGLLAYYQSGDEFVLAAGTMTRDALIASFQQFVASAETTKSSNLVWRTDVQNERATELAVRPLRAGVRSLLEGRFGKDSAVLAKFGFPPAKVAVKTSAAKTAAAVKAKATRAARGTRGSVQKKAVKGNVTGVVITPVTEGAVAAGPATTGAGAVAQLPAAAPVASATSLGTGAAAPAAGALPAAGVTTPQH